jgi:antitoxin MazE
MATRIRTRLVKIGNSQGVRIPKVLLDQLHMTDMIDLEVQDDQLVLRPSTTPRHGWAQQFQQMATRGDDQLLDPEDHLTTWDAQEWEWE